ncbi:Resistance protein [Corchorus olitorius]|uniref:Resistance protein n=1 Tax=Corchorus olitorius TaxID=93759 RepID=A0A1R3IFW0_9ROSI|nr:Resistance protein [Corchorus olitorius]
MPPSLETLDLPLCRHRESFPPRWSTNPPWKSFELHSMALILLPFSEEEEGSIYRPFGLNFSDKDGASPLLSCSDESSPFHGIYSGFLCYHWFSISRRFWGGTMSWPGSPSPG